LYDLPTCHVTLCPLDAFAGAGTHGPVTGLITLFSLALHGLFILPDLAKFVAVF